MTCITNNNVSRKMMENLCSISNEMEHDLSTRREGNSPLPERILSIETKRLFSQ